MEIRLDGWGFVFDSGVVDIYIQRSAIIFAVVVYLGLYARKVYLAREIKNKFAKNR
jgi:hypothetical protein